VKPFDIAAIINDAEYMRYVRNVLRPARIGGMRRRAILAALYRAWQASGLPSITGVEVGVKHGTMSHQVLAHLPCVSKLVMVDPWEEYPQDHKDRAKYNYASRDNSAWEQLYRRASSHVAQFGDRADIWRMTSVDAARRCFESQDQHFFVYLDARHQYDDVLEDCEVWWDNVLPGGLLCGDDFYPAGHDRRPSAMQVSTAIEEFARRKGLPVVPLHRNFFIAKPLVDG